MKHYLFFLIAITICMSKAYADDPEQTPTSFVPVHVNLKQHGYHLGDFVDMQLQFTLPETVKLDPLSLPLKGPMDAWFDLNKLQLKQARVDNGTQYDIQVVWQLFATVDQATAITLPTIALQTLPIANDDDEIAKPALIFAQPQTIYLSPVFPSLITSEQPKPLIAPPKFDTSTPLWLGLFSLFAALLVLFLWLWLTDKLPFWPYKPGPLLELNRSLRSHLVSTPLSIDQCKQVHHALSLVAEQSLYPNTLTQLYKKAPYLLAYKTDIDVFFHDSWALIFNPNAQQVTLPSVESLSWLKTATTHERLYRLQQRRFK